MTTITSLSEAVAELVHDGDTVALEGFTHLIPVAAGHEIIRQGRRDLTVVRMTPDIVYDQLIGAGCVRKMIFSWGGNPGVGSLYRFRDAVERGWPQPLEIEEHSHAGMANRYAAGAAGLPFAVLRGYRGTDLVDHTPTLAPVTCPFTGEELTAVVGDQPGRLDHPRPAGRSHRQRDDVGHHRRAEGGGARRAAGAGDGGGDRRRARAASGQRRPAELGRVARRRRARWHPPVVRAGLLRPRQRLLPGVGRDLGRPRPVPRVARRQRDELGQRRERVDRLHPGRRDDHRRRPLPGRRRGVLRRDRAAEHGRQPGPAHPRPEPGARLRVGHAGLEAAAVAAVDRRRRAGRHRRQRDHRARGLQLLAPARAHRRRVPQRRPDRPVRQHQLHGHRRLRDAEGAPARRRRGARDRGVLPGGDGDAAPDATGVRGAGRLRVVDGLRPRPGRPGAVGPARRRAADRRHRRRHPAPGPGDVRADARRAAAGGDRRPRPRGDGLEPRRRRRDRGAAAADRRRAGGAPRAAGHDHIPGRAA